MEVKELLKVRLKYPMILEYSEAKTYLKKRVCLKHMASLPIKTFAILGSAMG